MVFLRAIHSHSVTCCLMTDGYLLISEMGEGERDLVEPIVVFLLADARIVIYKKVEELPSSAQFWLSIDWSLRPLASNSPLARLIDSLSKAARHRCEYYRQMHTEPSIELGYLYSKDSVLPVD